jgi:peptidyl-prolyl cis-trans isomerase B (cyclophilin B)
MNKFHLLIFAAIISLFGLIVYTTQKETGGKSGQVAANSPTLSGSPDSLEFTNNKSSVLSADAINQKEEAPQQQQQQSAQQQTQGAELQGPINASVSATIKTSKGNIEVILFGKEAQKTVANFITKSKIGYYKNLLFHRVEDWVIQGGDPTGSGTGGNAIQTELNSLPFVTGSLGMAASSQMQMGQGVRISNDSQFFIVKQDADWLNGQYTNFGIVTEGMDVVNKIKTGDKILGITTE